MSVESLPEVGSYLCTLTLHRRANGEIHMNVTDMPPRLIETTGEEVPDRMEIIADWAVEGAARMVALWEKDDA
jgi:hypothetical protein